MKKKKSEIEDLDIELLLQAVKNFKNCKSDNFELTKEEIYLLNKPLDNCSSCEIQLIEKLYQKLKKTMKSILKN